MYHLCYGLYCRKWTFSVKYLHENRTEGCTINTMDYASGNGHLNHASILLRAIFDVFCEVILYQFLK